MSLDQETRGTNLSLWSLWPYLFVLFVYATAIAFVGSALHAHFGFPLDDSWIHQTVGRNFAWYHSLGYLPGQRSSGSTSLLWTLIISANYAFLPHVSPVFYCLAINSACLVSIGFIFLKLALRDGMPRGLAVLWAIAPAANGNFVWLSFTGMEHLLFIALSLACILLWVGAYPSRTTAVLAGLAMGLLCMTRPEGIVLPVILLALSRFFRRRLMQTALAAVVAAPMALAPFAVNLITSGALLPVTFKGRQWMYFAAGGSPSVYRKQLLEQWVMRPCKAVMALEGASLTSHGRMIVYALAAIILVLAAIALHNLFSQHRTATLVVCAWAAVHSLLYAIILPVSGHGGRYQPFLLLLLTPLLALGVSHGLQALLRTQRLAITGTAMLLGVAAAFSLPLWRSVLAAGIDHIHDSHGAMAAFLNRAQVHERVAVFDIGRIGYDRGGNLVDLGGLTDSAYVAYLYSNRVPEYLHEHGVTLIVLPLREDGNTAIGEQLHLTNNPALSLTSLHRECTLYAIWQLGWVETRHASQCQELFRIQAR